MPSWSFENHYQGLVVGLDEAGRGPWAGPVTAGAVVFLTRKADRRLLLSLDDSKKLSKAKREELYDLIVNERRLGRLDFGIGWASAEEIDSMNILQATFTAMRRAVTALSVQPQTALVDGNRTPSPFVCPVQTIIKGDGLSFSIAAASIMAKVSRDRYMAELAHAYPFYGFEQNAGYGTKAHREGIARYGITPQHRRSYRPIAEYLRSVSPD
jgi:ribonuclease HII